MHAAAARHHQHPAALQAEIAKTLPAVDEQKKAA
jgi:hypothetical protein